MLEIVVKGGKGIKGALANEARRQKRALATALKVEGFERSNQLKNELRSGSPGGASFAPMTYIARYRGGRIAPDRPYNMASGGRNGFSMIRAIGYQIDGPEDDPHVRIGWVPKSASSTYRRIAELMQKGGTHGMKDSARHALRRAGQRMGKRSSTRKYFFIRKTTQTFHTPARPVIDPYFRAHRMEFLASIHNKWRAKMIGERI